MAAKRCHVDVVLGYETGQQFGNDVILGILLLAFVGLLWDVNFNALSFDPHNFNLTLGLSL